MRGRGLKPGNANLPIGGLRGAIQENGVPGIAANLALAQEIGKTTSTLRTA
jgi:hypothetical protein